MMISILRYISLVLFLPVSVLLGLYLSHLISLLIPIWNEYILAVSLPIIGIVGAWVIAPQYRIIAAVAYFAIGLTLASLFALPSYYPEHHEHAYQPTYLPFTLTVLVGLTCIIGLLAIEQPTKTKDTP